MDEVNLIAKSPKEFLTGLSEAEKKAFRLGVMYGSFVAASELEDRIGELFTTRLYNEVSTNVIELFDSMVIDDEEE